MILNIVMPTNHHAWVLRKFYEALATTTPEDWEIKTSEEPIDAPDVVNYYMPYHSYERKSEQAKDIVFCTHPSFPDKFVSSAMQADHAITMCLKYLDALIACGIPGKKITCIYPGVDDVYLPPKKLRLFNPVLMTGREERKGMALWNALCATNQFYCVLSDGQMTAEEVYLEYLKADIIVCTSSMEGGPMCLYEACALGKPIVIGMDVGAQRESNYNNWMYVHDHTIEGLIVAIFDAQDDVKRKHEYRYQKNWRQYGCELWNVIKKASNDKDNALPVL